MNDDFETFFNANEARIHFQIKHLGIHTSAYGEFYTEGIFALWQAYRDFDPTKGKLGTYLNYRIRYRLIDLIRQKEREQARDKKYQAEQKIQHTNGTYFSNRKIPMAPLPAMTVKDPSIWHDIRSQLTENQWKWVKYFIIADLTIKEIMEIEDVTADAVKGWGREVRKKLRNNQMKEKLRITLED